MNEIPGPTPEEKGIETDRSAERQPVHELVEIITTRSRAARQEVEDSGEWPLPMRDLVEIREQTLLASLPTDYDEVESFEKGRYFLEFLADDPEGIYRFTTASNEGKRSLRAIVEALPEGQLTSELVISARNLRVEGDRREVDYPHHLSISTDDFIRLHERVKRIRLFVETYQSDGPPEPHLVTLDLRTLGLVPLDYDPIQRLPAKVLVIPYDYFVEMDDNLSTENSDQQFPSQTIVRSDSYPEVVPRENEPTVAEIIAACQEMLSPEDLISLQQLEDWDEAMAHANSLLIEYGVDDPESFWKQKGVLE